jgi:lantibiotic modifying enzyme
MVAGAVDDLTSGLVEDLGIAIAPTLLARFADVPGRQSVSPWSTVEHDAFVDSLLDGGLEHLLICRPALADLIEALGAAWQQRISQFLARIREDRLVLVERCGVALPFVEAQHVVGGSVLLTDKCQRRVVYKNRGVSMDAALAQALRWLNDQGLRHEFAVVDIVDRRTHGWMSYVAHDPPTNVADRSAYLHTTGALLALTTALGSADLHLANLRVDGTHPVILDAELLLRPRRASEVSDLPEVLTSGWLPFPGFVERSGLACELVETRPSRWQFLGTDGVRRRPRRPAEMKLRHALVHRLIADEPILPCISNGYAEMFRVLVRRGFPLEVFEGTEPRVVLRPSRLYDDAMARSVEPEALVSHRHRATAVENLVAVPPPSVANHPTVADAVRRIERSSVLSLHYPRFAAGVEDTSLRWDDQELGRPFAMSPLDRARARLAAMNDQSLAADLATIESTLASIITDTSRHSGGC